MTETRVEIYDPATREWAELEGITSIEITPDTTAFEAGMRSFRDALTPALEASAQAVRMIGEALRAATEQHAPTAPAIQAPRRSRPSRPAWQSPYGPPARRR